MRSPVDLLAWFDNRRMLVISSRKNKLIMNWRRLILFVPLLYGATAVISLPFGLLAVVWIHAGKAVPSGLVYAHTVVLVLTSSAVFYWLFRRQPARPLLHGVAVALITWVISLPIEVGIFKRTWGDWSRGAILLSLAVALGWLVYKKQRLPAVNEKTT